MKKRIFALILCVLMVFTCVFVTSCTPENENTDNSSTNTGDNTGNTEKEPQPLDNIPDVATMDGTPMVSRTAYKMAREYDIVAKLPILIAEKTGPHFAVGDTCYKYDEDNITYNPDGKAIVARDNEVSALRKEDVSKAYYNCHTDITIPYDELGRITVIKRDGSTEDIIVDGRFVVSGTEELNKPLDEM